MSSSSKGSERESFIDEFLSKVLPPVFRFGTGDATDISSNRSGQLDVVIEYPFSPSLANVGTSSTRLYLAESVAAVVEVKSTLSSQWTQAQQTATQLATVQRQFGAQMVMGGSGPTPQIPLFVAAYTGWSQLSTVQSNLAAAPNIAGVLIIDQGIFVSTSQYGGIMATGPWALWGLICALHQVTNSLQSASTNPLGYAL